jgi:hypothetical protein
VKQLTSSTAAILSTGQQFQVFSTKAVQRTGTSSQPEKRLSSKQLSNDHHQRSPFARILRSPHFTQHSDILQNHQKHSYLLFHQHQVIPRRSLQFATLSATVQHPALNTQHLAFSTQHSAPIIRHSPSTQRSSSALTTPLSTPPTNYRNTKTFLPSRHSPAPSPHITTAHHLPSQHQHHPSVQYLTAQHTRLKPPFPSDKNVPIQPQLLAAVLYIAPSIL